MYSVLRTKLDDSKLAALATSSKKADSVVLRSWKVDGKAPDKVFHLLRLDEVGDDIFTSQAFSSWIANVAIFKHHETKFEAAPQLEKWYSREALKPCFPLRRVSQILVR
ncbi:hypothetical protein GN244_ATG19680 [Phytophthora infestans]|uniref:Uncharacterized protein n=1 Tax=Phytophthora infestans TaxID=4787 RepID=A0A833S6X5_PHYIN|nr:hypothetical protein GN244_ATG19680 [Phytophthora infestans]